MKKLMALILAMIMLLSFAGCGSVKKSDIVGYWESPNRVEYGTNGKVMWRDHTFTFFEDGSGILTYIFNDSPTPTEVTFNYRIEGNKIIIPSSVGWEDSVYTYDDSGSVPKLMASQAKGYWYEKVSE